MHSHWVELYIWYSASSFSFATTMAVQRTEYLSSNLLPISSCVIPFLWAFPAWDRVLRMNQRRWLLPSNFVLLVHPSKLVLLWVMMRWVSSQGSKNLRSCGWVSYYTPLSHLHDTLTDEFVHPRDWSMFLVGFLFLADFLVFFRLYSLSSF